MPTPTPTPTPRLRKEFNVRASWQTQPIELHQVKDHPLYQAIIKNPETVIYYKHDKHNTICSLRTQVLVMNGRNRLVEAHVNVEAQGVSRCSPNDVKNDRLGKRVALLRALDGLLAFQGIQ